VYRYIDLAPVNLKGKIADNETVKRNRYRGGYVRNRVAVAVKKKASPEKMVGARLDEGKKYVWNMKNTAGRTEIRG
jgi:hypothetical protein